jgi:hypothetical protein
MKKANPPSGKKENWTLLHERQKTYQYIDPIVAALTLGNLIYRCKAEIPHAIKDALDILESSYSKKAIDNAVPAFLLFVKELSDDQDLFEELLHKKEYGALKI